MKRKQIDTILVDQAIRRKKIIKSVCFIVSVFIISLVFFFLFVSNNKTEYVSYREDSSIDYKVYLKENDFFGNNYLGSNNQYIASLIDYISADFNYRLNVEKENIGYKYQYRIEADVNVLEKETNNSLYKTNEVLVENEVFTSNNKSSVSINKNINIDYNYYNNLINKFISIYDLEDVSSTLTINMYVNVVGECEDLEDSNTDSVVSLIIPLTTKTVAIDLGYDLLDQNDENFMACKKADSYYYLYLLCSVVVLIYGVVLTFDLIKYVVKTRTAENIYDRELKKILNNYKSYIQKINNDFDLDQYQVLKVDSFTDMLEIRDTIQEPILMAENKTKTGVFFLIPSKTKILYLFGIKVSDIRRQMKKK